MLFNFVWGNSTVFPIVPRYANWLNSFYECFIDLTIYVKTANANFLIIRTIIFVVAVVNFTQTFIRVSKWVVQVNLIGLICILIGRLTNYSTSNCIHYSSCNCVAIRCTKVDCSIYSCNTVANEISCNKQIGSGFNSKMNESAKAAYYQCMSYTVLISRVTAFKIQVIEKTLVH